jgi:serine/threonine protein kinase
MSGVSMVYAGTLHGQTEVAVKVVKMVNGDVLTQVKDEVRRANLSRHRNVVQAFGIVALVADTVWVVMERLGVSLGEANVSDPSIRMKYTLDIIAGMEHMHKPGHGAARYGLKPANILLTQDGDSVKIVDFGVAQTTSTLAIDAVASIRDTLRFMAPELFAEELDMRDTACDIYPFAVVVAELWTGTVAWAGTPKDEIPDLVGRCPSPDDPSRDSNGGHCRPIGSSPVGYSPRIRLDKDYLTS